jgi:hypothetical protein
VPWCGPAVDRDRGAGARGSTVGGRPYADGDVWKEPSVKTCSTCRRSLEFSEFNLRSRSADGRQSVCRACNTARARRYYSENLDKHRKAVAAQVAKTRAAHLERIGDYLRAHPCADCGQADIRVLDFDHRDGAQKSA